MLYILLFLILSFIAPPGPFKDTLIVMGIALVAVELATNVFNFLISFYTYKMVLKKMSEKKQKLIKTEENGKIEEKVVIFNKTCPPHKWVDDDFQKGLVCEICNARPGEKTELE